MISFFANRKAIVAVALLCVLGIGFFGCDSGSRKPLALGAKASAATGGGTTGSGSTGGGALGGTPGSVNVTLTATASLQTPRGLMQAVTLNDGRVFVHQGLTAQQGQQSIALDGEVYDPVADTWESTAALGGNAGIPVDPNNTYTSPQGSGPAPVWAFDYTMTKLPSGKVLIAGGYGFNSFDNTQNPPAPIWADLNIAHIFDPQTNTYDLVPSKMNVGRSSHHATLLSNGMVLIAGGFNGNTPPGQSPLECEIYDPASNSFRPTNQTAGPLSEGKVYGNMFTTPGGAIVTSIAYLGPDPANPSQVTLLLASQPCEEYGIQSNLWNAGPAPAEPRLWAGGVTMANGNYILGGGYTVNTQTGSQGQTGSIELYETSASKFATFGAMQAPRLNPMVAEFGSTSDVLFIGGMNMGQTSANALDSIEMWSATQNNVIAAFQMPSDRSGGAAVTLADGRVFIIGGFSGGGAQDPVDGSDGTPLADCAILSR